MVKIEVQNDNFVDKDILNWTHWAWQLTGLCKTGLELLSYTNFEMFQTSLILLGRQQIKQDLGSHSQFGWFLWKVVKVRKTFI